MTKKKTEYQVKYIRKDRQWQVTHKHSYDNYAMGHAVYIGSSWSFCMWLATGDPFYVYKFDAYAYGRIRSQCGSRTSEYHTLTRAKKRLIESH